MYRRLSYALIVALLATAAPRAAAQRDGVRERMQEWRELAQDLDLSDAQRQELRRILRDPPGAPGSPELRAALGGILTPGQRAKWAALLLQRAPSAPVPLPLPQAGVHKDIVYVERAGATRQATSLDLYVPETPGPNPMVAYIHGGGWKKGDKQAVHLKPALFLGEGAILASLNYRLIPEKPAGSAPLHRIDPEVPDYAAQMQDLAAAIAWLCTHAGEYGGDPKRIYVVGHSAGAHLAALLATDHQYLRAAGVDPTVLRGAIILDGGGLDIKRQITELAPLINRSLYKNVFGEDATHWRDASPIAHVKADAPIAPFLLMPIAGRDETRAQAQGFAEALRKAGHHATVHIAEDKTHGSLNRELGTPGDPTTDAVIGFFRMCEAAAKSEE